MLTYPGKPEAGTEMKAEEVRANLEGLDNRLSSVETTIDNLTTDAQTYGNGVFPDGLSASQVSTQLQYTTGSLICNHLFYAFTTLAIDFLGYSADTYYVECDASGNVDIYTSKSSSRTNLNTVVWNGSGFDSVTEADRNVLATYQEIIDARGLFDTLEFRLDDMTSDIAINTTHSTGDGSDHADVATNTSDISTLQTDVNNIEDGTTPIPHKITNQSGASLAITSAHDTIVCDTTSNAITLDLPDASTVLGYEFTIFLETYGSGNDVTVNCASGDTLDGTNSVATLVSGSILIIRAISDNRWLIIKESGVTLS